MGKFNPKKIQEAVEATGKVIEAVEPYIGPAPTSAGPMPGSNRAQDGHFADGSRDPERVKQWFGANGSGNKSSSAGGSTRTDVATTEPGMVANAFAWVTQNPVIVGGLAAVGGLLWYLRGRK